MKLLFVADPLESFVIYKDSTYAMMREAQSRGHTVSACEPRDLHWSAHSHSATGRISAVVRDITLTGEKPLWFTEAEPAGRRRRVALCDMDAVIMRKDPPFDGEFFYCTHMLSQAEREGARVFNRPGALREHPEKLAIMEFPQYIAPTLVTRNPADIRAFHAEHQDVILKPLDGMGGMGIYRVRADGLNLGSIIETLNQGGRTSVMVQKYLPEIVDGDKRVLIIDGEPVPYCLARIPQGNEVRGNLAAGGKGVGRPLTEADRTTARAIGQVLAPRGLTLIGLDIIGTRVTEINVTSPTCFQEIQVQKGCNVAALFIDAIERGVLTQRV